MEIPTNLLLLLLLSPYLTYGVVAIMALAALGAFVLGGLFFFKRSGLQAANWVYGTLLLLGGGMQLHFVFAYMGYFRHFPNLQFLPIYFSLSLPVLFFYYVKLTLYPKYRIKASDTKHFVLPLGQLLYLFAIWWIPSLRLPGGRYFYNPFYGGLEQALFILLFPAYIVFAYQYYRRRAKQPGISQASLRVLWYVHKLIKGTMLFVLAYAILGLSDFFAFKFLRISLMDSDWFAALSAAAFVALLGFFVVYGFQVLLWGRRLLKLDAKP